MLLIPIRGGFQKVWTLVLRRNRLVASNPLVFPFLNLTPFVSFTLISFTLISFTFVSISLISFPLISFIYSFFTYWFYLLFLLSIVSFTSFLFFFIFFYLFERGGLLYWKQGAFPIDIKRLKKGDGTCRNISLVRLFAGFEGILSGGVLKFFGAAKFNENTEGEKTGGSAEIWGISERGTD